MKKILTNEELRDYHFKHYAFGYFSWIHYGKPKHISMISNSIPKPHWLGFQVILHSIAAQEMKASPNPISARKTEELHKP
jgi:hypothetical protein